MNTLTQTPFITTGDPTLLGLLPCHSQHIADYFNNPLRVENYRRAVRAWFAAYLLCSEESRSPFDLEGNVMVFEVIDELLSGLIQQASKVSVEE